MGATDVVQGYFDAWNRHDPEAIAATFVQGGTYTDPNVPEGLSGRAIAEYASGLFAAFPDLLFDLDSHSSTDDGVVAARWVMRGTNTGPLRENPPTRGTVALPGADFIAVEGDKVRSVQGYFDRSTFVEQLGLQVIVQPRSVGPFSFGSSVRAQSGWRRAQVFSASPGSRSVRRKPRRLESFGPTAAAVRWICPGFIAWIGLTIAEQLFTITASGKLPTPQQLPGTAPRQEARRAVLQHGLRYQCADEHGATRSHRRAACG